MNADELRARQTPLKARYKDDPASAWVTLRAVGRVEQASITCVLESGKPGVPVGLHPAAGGTGADACSGDILLEALVGCGGVTLAAVATAMGITLTSARVLAEGDVDFRGTLGVSREAPVGFARIRVRFEIQADAAADKLHKLAELAERYCVIFQSLKPTPVVEVAVST